MDNEPFLFKKPLLKNINPSGFYRRQLESCATGLTGNIEDYFADLGPKNAWKCGEGDAWERGPYYLDGLVALSFLLKNDDLSARVEAWIKPIIASAKPDGRFGPTINDDVWPRLVALKALRTVHDNLQDSATKRLIDRFIENIGENLETNAPVLWAWARLMEIGAVLDSIDSNEKRKEIYECARSHAFDWNNYFANFQYRKTTTHYLDKTLFNLVLPIIKKLTAQSTGPKSTTAKDAQRFNQRHLVHNFLATHGVNVAMALKYPAYKGFYGQASVSNDAWFKGLEQLLRHHGNALGLFSSDEHLNGPGPRQGVELCTIVEAMFSMEEILRMTGDPRAADYLELWAYNAWLAVCTPDMTAHQYVIQPNQTKAGCKHSPFYDVGRTGTVFGLAPNFGCCAANMHQGWPKLANAAVLFHQQDIFIFAYLTGTYLFDTDEGPVEVVIEGDYPFGDRVAISIVAQRPGKRTVHLRIPYGAETIVEMNQESSSYTNRKMVDIKFEGRFQAQLKFGFAVETHFHGKMVSLRRGPLIYSLPIPHREHYLKGIRPFHDREFIASVKIKKPILLLDAKKMAKVIKMDALTSYQDKYPGVRYMDVATCQNEPIRLIPLGLTRLRISQFAYRKEKAYASQ